MCDDQATSLANLSHHVRNIHENCNVICTDCNKTLKQWSLARHRKSFHLNEEPQIQKCNICTYQTIHTSSFRRHVKAVHKWK